MSAAELTLYNLIRSEFKLSDEKAMEFVQSIERLQEKETIRVSGEYKSIFKEDFYKMDLQLEQLKTKMDLQIEQLKTKIDLQIEQLNTRIESANSNTLKWFMGGFITITLMILGLFATILLK